MLYLGIDQHARQITISLRADNGDVLQARQVSTQPDKIHAFFQRRRSPWLQSDASLGRSSPVDRLRCAAGRHACHPPSQV